MTVELPIRIGEADFGEAEFEQIRQCFENRRLTMGPKVAEFEKRWADYIGTDYALLCNSGSSANLLQLSALTTRPFSGIPYGSEVITGAVTFGTTIMSIVQAGLKPVLIDVGADFNLRTDLIEKAITRKTKMIMPVHLLGGPCDMDEIMEIANKKDLIVMEDSCEAHGAEYHGSKTGSIGLSGSFSNYFSHHITTAGEGGIVTTNDEDLIEVMRVLRGWGQPHQVSKELKDFYYNLYPKVDRRHFFYAMGYNFKPTEFQGAFGLAQLDKIEQNIAHRRENFKWFNKNLRDEPFVFKPEEKANTRHVSLYYGFESWWKKEPNKTDNLMTWLEQNQIETRSIEASNFVTQPVGQWLLSTKQMRVAGKLTRAEAVDANGMGFGNHPRVGPEEREYIRRKIEEYFTNEP